MGDYDTSIHGTRNSIIERLHNIISNHNFPGCGWSSTNSPNPSYIFWIQDFNAVALTLGITSVDNLYNFLYSHGLFYVQSAPGFTPTSHVTYYAYWGPSDHYIPFCFHSSTFTLLPSIDKSIPQNQSYHVWIHPITGERSYQIPKSLKPSFERVLSGQVDPSAFPSSYYATQPPSSTSPQQPAQGVPAQRVPAHLRQISTGQAQRQSVGVKQQQQPEEQQPEQQQHEQQHEQQQQQIPPSTVSSSATMTQIPLAAPAPIPPPPISPTSIDGEMSIIRPHHIQSATESNYKRREYEREKQIEARLSEVESNKAQARASARVTKHGNAAPRKTRRTAEEMKEAANAASRRSRLKKKIRDSEIRREHQLFSMENADLRHALENYESLAAEWQSTRNRYIYEIRELRKAVSDVGTIQKIALKCDSKVSYSTTIINESNGHSNKHSNNSSPFLNHTNSSSSGGGPSPSPTHTPAQNQSVPPSLSKTSSSSTLVGNDLHPPNPVVPPRRFSPNPEVAMAVSQSLRANNAGHDREIREALGFKASKSSHDDNTPTTKTTRPKARSHSTTTTTTTTNNSNNNNNSNTKRTLQSSYSSYSSSTDDDDDADDADADDDQQQTLQTSQDESQTGVDEPRSKRRRTSRLSTA